MSTITREKLIEDLKASTQNSSGMFEIGEETICALMSLLTAPAVAWLWSHRKHPREVTLVRPEDDEKAEAALWSGWSCQALYAEVPASTPMKDHQIRELVNELRNIAVEYHGTQQLRERIARTIRAAMLQGAEPVTTAYKLRDALETIRNSGIEIDAEKIFAERDALNSPVVADAYDIESFGIFSAIEGESGLLLKIERFWFGTENCPQIGKENMVPKFALQAIINRLQAHCDGMNSATLIDILSAPVGAEQGHKE